MSGAVCVGIVGMLALVGAFLAWRIRGQFYQAFLAQKDAKRTS